MVVVVDRLYLNCSNWYIYTILLRTAGNIFKVFILIAYFIESLRILKDKNHAICQQLLRCQF